MLLWSNALLGLVFGGSRPRRIGASLSLSIAVALGACESPTSEAPAGAPARPGVSASQVSSASVTLTGTAFSDPDGDAHAATEWLIDERGGNWSTPVYARVETVALTSLRPQGLPGSTQLQARIRYRDQRGDWSPFSEPAMFTTLERGPLITISSALLAWESTVGDRIGGGRSARFTLADGSWGLTGEPFYSDQKTSIRVTFDGPDPNDYWLLFAAPSGPLAVGTYPNAQRWGAQSAGRPGLSLFGGGVGCNEISGEFTILELQVRDNLIERLRATFVQRCDGRGELRGEVDITRSWT